MKPKKLVRGVGINDAEYVVQVRETVSFINKKQKFKTIWLCPYYQKWYSMLTRCYSDKLKESRPTYSGCTVVEEWHLFSNFKSWMEQQEWSGLHLDKDILVRGNKVYGPNTCCFVPSYINNVFLQNSSDGNLPWGVARVSKPKAVKPYMAQIGGNNKNIHLGYYLNADDAHKAWQLAKAESVENLINQYAREPFFRTDVADSLMSLVWNLRNFNSKNKETKYLWNKE